MLFSNRPLTLLVRLESQLEEQYPGSKRINHRCDLGQETNARNTITTTVAPNDDNRVSSSGFGFFSSFLFAPFFFLFTDLKLLFFISHFF
jgi:hypothetical protein